MYSCFILAKMMHRLKVEIIVGYLNRILDLSSMPFDEFLKFRNLIINKLGKFMK